MPAENYRAKIKINCGDYGWTEEFYIQEDSPNAALTDLTALIALRNPLLGTGCKIYAATIGDAKHKAGTLMVDPSTIPVPKTQTGGSTAADMPYNGLLCDLRSGTAQVPDGKHRREFILRGVPSGATTTTKVDHQFVVTLDTTYQKTFNAFVQGLTKPAAGAIWQMQCLNSDAVALNIVGCTQVAAPTPWLVLITTSGPHGLPNLGGAYPQQPGKDANGNPLKVGVHGVKWNTGHLLKRFYPVNGTHLVQTIPAANQLSIIATVPVQGNFVNSGTVIPQSFIYANIAQMIFMEARKKDTGARFGIPRAVNRLQPLLS